MRWLYLPLLVVGLFCSCDKAAELGKSNGDDDGEAETTPAGDTEEEQADEPVEVQGGFCKLTVAESYPERGTLNCDFSGPTAPIKLPSKAVLESFHVEVDGVLIGSDRYTYDPEAGTITFIDDVTGKKVTISWDYFHDTGTGADLTVGKIVDMTGLDGCKLMIELANGSRLEPTNLPAEFAHAGMKVKFRYTEPGDVASVCMAGKIVNVSEMVVDSSDCATLALVMEAVLTEFGKDANVCSSDADCASVGGGKSSCEAPHGFTKNANAAGRVARYTAAETSFVSACQEAQTASICSGTKTVHCTSAACTGVIE